MCYGNARNHQLADIFNETDVPKIDSHIDYSIPIDGLPQFFRKQIEDFPKRDAFLVPDPKLIGKWRKRLADLGEGLKIGISWFGGTKKVKKQQSIPLSHWKNLLSAEAFFVNLQYGNTADEVAQFSAENNITIHDWEDNNALLDLDNQAALISEVDLVISVDNATVHSCIALGTEVWDIIDPNLNLMWMDNGTNASPLSPHLQLFKKKVPDTWNTVLKHVEEQLKKRLSAECRKTERPK